MPVVAVALLVVGVAGAIGRPWRVPAWVFPVAAAAVAIAARVIDPGATWDAIEPLAAPIAFLLLAVPLAVLLDELDVFGAAARLISGRHAAVGMWCICAVAVAVLNLDAAVVLCTPLAVALARRGDLDPVAFGFQPALLACLASSALPVSNLTNLIAVSQDHLTPVELLRYLGLPTLAACAAGYGAWRLAFRHRDVVPRHPFPREGAMRRPLLIGGAVLATLLVGFLLGRYVGIAAWMVVAVVDVALIGLRRRVPWDAVPWGTAAVAAGLAVVAAAAADRTGLADWLVTNGVWSQVFVAAGAANVINNLPAFLVAVPHTTSVPQVAALLLGVNAGPTIVVTGSLAGLLWLDSARRSGLVVGPREYARVGVMAGLPALVAATAVLALTT